jgi:HlyD family secretion protein
MKKIVILIAALVVLFIVMFFLIKSKEQTKSPNIFASGTIEVTEVEVSSKIMGKVLKINVDEGDKVDTGQVLIELDHRELDAQKAQSQAAWSSAQIQVSQAKTNLDYLEKNLKRIKELFKTGSATQQQLDDLTSKFELAQGQYDLTQSQVEQVKASINLVETQIENAIIQSPLKGTALQKNISLGETVLPGNSLLTLGDLSKVNLKIYVPEPHLGKVKLGQKVKVKVDSFPQKDFFGKITWISNEAEFTPKNIQTKEERVKLVFGVKVELENPASELKPGMPADAEVLVE